MIFSKGQPQVLVPQIEKDSRLINEYVNSEAHGWLRGQYIDYPEDWTTEVDLRMDTNFGFIPSVAYSRIFLPKNAPHGAEVVCDDGNGGFVKPNTTIVLKFRDETKSFVKERRRLFFYVVGKRPASNWASVSEFLELYKWQGFAFRRFEDGAPIYWI
ncbi:hypothetical protein ACNHKD_09155 [Methylocystis sp. JAN1]|uniref:hypothetical protein n=1 Tax=Methylocystis sp. JAN1 TaxID=3397211 RepID=UPI003FA23054